MIEKGCRMCGLAGVIWRRRPAVDNLEAVGRRMAQSIWRRGPDDQGVWCDPELHVLLAHVRLSIVDLSPAGHQPMISDCQRYVLVFNGEVYNHLDLRAELGARQWRGHSDTETLLAGFAAWGVRATVERAVGMFAFALWDKQSRTLTLGRDRLGEKPLYYGWHGDAFLFSSELKAMDACPGFSPQLNRDAIALYLRHSVIPAPYSIWQGIAKLEPGCIAVLDGAAIEAARMPEPQPYWSMSEVVKAGQAHPLLLPDAEAILQLDQTITSAVSGQMLADVPLGAFLSGGVDSSLIVSMMQKLSTQPVKTFSIGFDVPGFNEAEHAKAVAQHLGTDHTELYVKPEDALDVIPRLPTLYDEPFADSSQIPTFLVSQLARQQVTVALSGDAGDELFCGYTRYLQMHKLAGMLGKLPGAVRQLGAASLQAFTPQAFGRCYRALMPVLPAAFRAKHPEDKLGRLQHLLAAQGDAAVYRALISHWADPAAVVLGASEPSTWLTGRRPLPTGLSPVEKCMFLDSQSYLSDDILVKVDRAAMGVSLETRVPLLDHRVVELAWRLPMQQKLREGQGKWLLRQVLYQYVPRAMIDRPKMGFGVPVGQWLQGPLREWAQALLEPARLAREGVFDAAVVSTVWTDFLAGRTNAQYLLWDILMFQAWLENRQRVLA